ncbi:MAG: PDZ domain-containing protein [Verrucomicrobia bacterium]|nr:PDZ domain-containing protein [Verrucomicrobiota bacterium]MCH8527360.1 PDZ domain-containing protein [Kiritimatiellia bacterium]
MLKKHLAVFLSFAAISSLSVTRAVEANTHAPGMLGVALHEVFADEVGRFQLPGEYGALVEAVQPGSPAEAAGIQVDDVIVGFNSTKVESARALRRLVQESPAGRTVELRLIRGGAPALVRVTLGEGRETVLAPAASAPRAPRVLGVGVEPISLQLTDLFGLDDGVGLFVAQVQKGSAADRAGIQARDLLIAVGDQAVTTGEGLSEILNGLPGSEAVFTLIRNGVRENVTVRF